MHVIANIEVFGDVTRAERGVSHISLPGVCQQASKALLLLTIFQHDDGEIRTREFIRAMDDDGLKDPDKRMKND
ncbi:hypothetical protein V1478_007443, partial [Vespula squamosa]